jgi:hypothetical protein
MVSALSLVTAYSSIILLSSFKLIRYLWRTDFDEMLRNRIKDNEAGGREDKVLRIAIIGWSMLMVGYLPKVGYSYVMSRWSTKTIEGENNDTKSVNSEEVSQ